jgi:hypothetical protein
VHNDDWVSGGLIFSLPGTHPRTHLTISGDVTNAPVFCDPARTRVFSYAGSEIFFQFNADVAQDDVGLHPTTTAADPAAFQDSYRMRGGPPGCETLYWGPEAQFRIAVGSDQPTPVRVALHYRVPASKGFANVNCADPTSNPYPSDSAPCDAQFTAFQTLTPTGSPPTPVPVGAFGGLGLAAVAGAGLGGARLRSRRRVRAPRVSS